MGSVPPVAGQYVQGFVGLNTFIYEPAGHDPENQSSTVTGNPNLESKYFEGPTLSIYGVGLTQNTIGMGLNTPAKTGIQTYKNYLFSHELANTASYFSALMLHRNGPYGFPMWKQMRIGQNPLTRRQIKENVFTIVMEPGSEIRRQYKEGVEVLTNRYGDIRRFDEVPVTSRFKPFSFVGGTAIIDPRTKNNMLKRFDIRATLANETCFFNNDELNRIYNRTPCENENYSLIRDMYLDDALNDDCSPVDSFELFKYRETVYPPQIYTYKSYTRERTTFSFPWNTDRLTRNKEGLDADGNNAASGLYNYPITASSWPLDPESDYLTRADIDPWNCASSGIEGQPSNTERDAGLLARGYGQLYWQAAAAGDSCVYPTPFYSRRQTLKYSGSVVAPDGIDIPATGSTWPEFFQPEMYLGSPLWEAAEQAGKQPFQNSYADFAHQLRLRGQGYSIAPEYRESDLVDKFYVSGALNVTGGLFSVTGGLASQNSDEFENFFTIYTNSDFLKHFDLVKEHHKDFVEPSSITLRCKAVKKFVPYEGFYPAQRCDQIAQNFFLSYKDHLSVGETDVSHQTQEPTHGYSEYPDAASSKRSMQDFLTPLLAPGVLFNTIKAGVACDWPYLTSSFSIDSDGTVLGGGAPGAGNQILCVATGSDFAAMKTQAERTFIERIPFEALIEPEKHIANKPLFAYQPKIGAGSPAEIHSSSYGLWSGQGTIFYSLMMDNFLAEVPEFFLENKNYTYLYSKKQDDPSFGAAIANKPYAMRVKMYKTLDGEKQKITGSSGYSHDVPQTIPTSSVSENLTMYSRPTAFGPPSFGVSKGGAAYAGNIFQKTYYFDGSDYLFGSKYGYNFPFTPPYYHGEAWADILFRPTESKKYTLSEIIASSSVNYYRFFDPLIHDDVARGATIGGSNTVLYGPQAPHTINSNAMQLNSSVNIFSKGIIDTNRDILRLAGTEDPDSRWIIQSKFETPILNFKDVAVTNAVGSGSIARGMWHQYGVLPKEDEGIMMQVTDIPKSFLRGVGFSQSDVEITGSLSDLVGFTSQPARMGEVATQKRVKESVVAIPFVERDGHRQYFKMPRQDLEYALDALTDPLNQTKRGKVGNSVFQMIVKMKQYNFPPVMNFIDFDEVDPFYMYIFEFEHEFTRLDLADIWQNLPPTLNERMETAEATISHPLLANEILGGGVVERPSPGGGGMITLKDAKGNEVPDNIKWMVFKVKQKAKKKYYEKIVGRRESSQVSSKRTLEGVGYGPTGRDIKFGYNWPYDFFSMVELIKIDAEITLSDVEPETETIKPRTGKNVPPKVTEKFEELNKHVKKGRGK